MIVLQKGVNPTYSDSFTTRLLQHRLTSVHGAGVQDWRLWDGRVAQSEPLLNEVGAQHRLDLEQRAPALALGRVDLDQQHRVGPRHRLIHLREKLELARSLRAQIQSQARLLNGSDPRVRRCTSQAGIPGVYADHP